ncbi:MAG: YafY family transcriptional regulator [Deltaproteobacteria bacterium]|nr:YafY family transcriptional regulator [Deltaproteobacteria bacterium]
MLTTSARLLQLLAILSERRSWAGSDLVERLDVTPRTLRRDIARLRELGYPVESTSGPAGGYALSAGGAVPPLSFEADEIVAVALGLSLVGLEAGERKVRRAAEAAVAKVGRVLPPRLQRRLSRLRGAVHSGGRAELGRVAQLAGACADQRVLTFEYERGDGTESEREVEPHGVTLSGVRWYLVAHDRGRDDWRTFRVDRMRKLRRAGSFVPREAPAEDLAAWVREGRAGQRWPLEGRIRYALSAEELRARMPDGYGEVEAVTANSSRLIVTASSWETMAAWLPVLGTPIGIEGPDELRDAIRELADRLRDAAGGLNRTTAERGEAHRSG